MKKLLFAIFLFFVFFPTDNVGAEYAFQTITVTCPATTDINTSVTCILSGKSGYKMLYDDTGAAIPGSETPDAVKTIFGCINTSDNIVSHTFTPDPSWPDYHSNATDEIYLNDSTGKSGDFTVGTLTINVGALPDTDNYINFYYHDFAVQNHVNDKWFVAGLSSNGQAVINRITIRTNPLPVAVAPTPTPVVTAPVATPTATPAAAATPVADAEAVPTSVDANSSTLKTLDPSATIAAESPVPIAKFRQINLFNYRRNFFYTNHNYCRILNY